MRIAKKRQAQEQAEALALAHQKIKEAMEAGNTGQALALLEECQGDAIALGGLIEAEEGGCFPTIRLLEDYCEQIYRIHEKVRLDTAADGWRAHADLEASLHMIELSIKNDISTRKEVVFLPYKASMWDSLESVWKAAKDDPDCDAYVIPIPYYDKNPDGSLRKEYYEADLYPAYVPVTRYEEYDFEGRRPDEIYIHNAYDNGNHVTSVHPFFYSKNLKRFTDRLIYIPYFVLGEFDPADEAAERAISPFCMMPGIFHADRVIVQSEAMRRIYINVLTKAMLQGRDCTNPGQIRRYWENKIEGSGSPKFDKVLNTKKEDLEIPDAWRRVIEKPDGTWKKIIFYNTSIHALLTRNEQMLKKIRDVLHIFYENRENAALLWRPHPLMESTIKSMRPGLWEEYRQIRDKYREAGWGIYDDTADFDRAIVLSNAYYGDASSVLQLYLKTDKPAMVQDAACISGTIKNPDVPQSAKL